MAGRPLQQNDLEFLLQFLSLLEGHSKGYKAGSLMWILGLAFSLLLSPRSGAWIWILGFAPFRRLHLNSIPIPLV